MFNYKEYVLLALFLVLSLSLIEALILSRRMKYDWKAFAFSVSDQLGSQLLEVIIPLSFITMSMQFVSKHKIISLSMDSWAEWLLLLLSLEFCYYWAHRASHHMRWFWLCHSVHHTPNQLNLSVAYRLSWIRKNGTQFFYFPLVWMGFSIEIMAYSYLAHLIYQAWLHTTWIPKLGWLEYVINTPSSHRVHHSRNAEYLGANYGGMLGIFDDFFGTYKPEREDLPCDYGLVERETSYNPIKIEFGPWYLLLKDMVRSRNPITAICYLVMPPGWKPKEKTKTSLVHGTLTSTHTNITRPVACGTQRSVEGNAVSK